MGIRIYDPRLKLDAINGCLPREFKKLVRPFTLNNWKKEKWPKMIGYEYYNNRDYDLNILKSSISAIEKELELIKAENEVINLIVKISSNSKDFNQLIYKNKSHIVEIVEKNKKLFPVKKFHAITNLSKNTFYNLRQLNKKECDFSKNFICIKKQANRISIEEEETMLQLLRDRRYEHFPLSSLIWMAKYESLVFACRQTWDKVKKENLIQRKKIKKARQKSYESLKADYANQYLHADVTYFKIENGKTYFIYIVKDNFSKYIKSWAICDSINPDTRIETFKLALSDINKDFNFKITFVTDSGIENRAKKVLEFINKIDNVELSFARKDIPFSNSMIEKFNHDLKYMYLYRERIKSLKDLNKMVEIAVKEHNYTKRMERLNGQTPYEVYSGIPAKSEWILEQWREARQKRKDKLNALICCFGEIEKCK